MDLLDSRQFGNIYLQLQTVQSDILKMDNCLVVSDLKLKQPFLYLLKETYQ